MEVVTDSEYVKNGITTWIHGWKRKGWMTAAKKPVVNQDLWKALDEQVEPAQDHVDLDQGPRDARRTTIAATSWRRGRRGSRVVARSRRACADR